ncbi:LexA family protein [Deinococcus yunweiensis]|uniref:LexA family protein n=1 Tax=Deinococcus yunweiensis TaxID=367282 RepID=UPI00398F5232
MLRLPEGPDGRQGDVLSEIAVLEAQGEAVTTGRLGERLGMPRQNVRMYVLALRDKGLILYDASERRAAVMRLTDAGRVAAGLSTPVPLSFPMVGEVAAGEPSLADQRIEGYAARLTDVLDLKEGDFFLRVRGESMTGIGIYPGDLVAIHPTREEPLQGDIALVAVPGENTATLKRWHRNNGTVTLHSENPEFAPMTFKVQDVQIQGCLVGIIGSGRNRRGHPAGER